MPEARKLYPWWLRDRLGIIPIVYKLDETAKTEAAKCIIAMNVSQRLAQWLLRLFGIRRELLGFQ